MYTWYKTVHKEQINSLLLNPIVIYYVNIFKKTTQSRIHTMKVNGSRTFHVIGNVLIPNGNPLEKKRAPISITPEQ